MTLLCPKFISYTWFANAATTSAVDTETGGETYDLTDWQMLSDVVSLHAESLGLHTVSLHSLNVQGVKRGEREWYLNHLRYVCCFLLLLCFCFLLHWFIYERKTCSVSFSQFSYQSLSQPQPNTFTCQCLALNTTCRETTSCSHICMRFYSIYLWTHDSLLILIYESTFHQHLWREDGHKYHKCALVALKETKP